MKQLKVKFKRLDNVVLMKVVQQDCSSIGLGTLFEHNGFKLRSLEGCEIDNNELFVRGLDDSADNHVDYHKFKTSEQAKNYIKRAKECINAYNDSIRVKEVFDIEKYQGEYVMHCETEDDANEFLKYLHSVGRKWFVGDSYLNYNEYEGYKEKTCYYFNEGGFSSINFYRENGFKILRFKDFTFEIKEKEDKPFPQIGDTYYYCNSFSSIDTIEYENDAFDKKNIYENNFWQTEEECKRYDEIKQKEMELSHKFTKEEWEDINIPKYIINCSYKDKELYVVHRKNLQSTSLLFKTEKDAQAFIDFCGYEDYKKYVLGVK